MKAKFFDRLLAYIIDTILITLVVSLIFYKIEIKTPTQDKLYEMQEKYTTGEISQDEYMVTLSDPETEYNIQKESILPTTVTLVLTIAYIIIFQYANKGQTIGKKLMKIRVVDNKTDNKVSILKGALRTIFNYNIISCFLGIVLLYVLKPGLYYKVYMALYAIEMAIIVASAVMVLYRKDGRGLHDLISSTKVVKEER